MIKGVSVYYSSARMRGKKVIPLTHINDKYEFSNFWKSESINII